MPKHRHTSLIFYLILAVSTAGLITYLSSQIAPESNDLSKSFTKWIMDLFVSGYSSETLQHYNGIARKAAHFTLYFLLGFSLIGVLQHQQRAPKLPTAVFLGAMFAALDELHQHFVDGRGPQITDVLLDTCGVLVGSLVMLGIAALLRRGKQG